MACARRDLNSTTALRMALLVVLVAVVAVDVVSAEDFYQLLGVARDAPEDKIKSAFKKLTRQYHPDRQRGKTDAEKETAKQMFMRIADAYEVLSNAKKREEYDRSGGRGVVTAGDDRNYLKANLFKEDFDGDEIGAEEIEKALQGKLKTSLFVMFWSSNFPECVDAGLAFKELAARLKGSTVRVASYQCDFQPHMCRDLRVGNPPTALMFVARTRSKWDRYSGRFEPQALTEFAVRYLRVGHRLTAPTSEAGLLEVCPDPMQSLPASRFAAPYFFETAKKCYRGESRAEFLAFQYSACYDCQTELSIALETLHPVMSSLKARTVNCKVAANKGFCAAFGPQKRDRAWTVVRVVRRCWYATKRPYAFSDEHCEEAHVTPFDGKYASAEYVNFIISSQPSHIVNLHTLNRVMRSNDSYAVLFFGAQGVSAGVKQHWEILARRVNTVRPVFGRKGHRVVVAQMDCSKPHSQCAAVQGRELPVVALYSFGLKAKKAEPTVYSRIGSGAAMLKHIMRDMEPLHLHLLTPQNYNTKVNGGLAKGKRWFVMYNAGSWCPPCNQMRGQWPRMTRLIQNHATASKKISVGLVDCEKFKMLCNQLGIDNYPTMSYFAPGRSRMEYNGNRDAQVMADWAIDAIENRLQSLGWQELRNALHSGQTLMVCFTAGTWCPPCTQLKPVFKKVANTLTQIAATQVDCDEQQQLCMQFGIDGYPTLVMFHKGRQVHYEGGVKTVESITRWAKGFL